MTFKLVGYFYFGARSKKETFQSFEKSVKNLSALTVVKDQNNENKISISLSANQFNFCFNVSIGTYYYDHYGYKAGGEDFDGSDGYLEDWLL